ncbi:hypothetical protein DN868_13605 [Salmonella enterica]|nr:hypothetical protein [Salmonella enterica]EBU0596628.1 hypothetical protein [Salmonella enterica]ECW8446265.1 hypothetical protein [Salmonella enterica]
MITEKNNVFYCDCGFSWRRGMSGSHNCEDGLRAKLTDMAVQLANAESKCRELAAENSTIKVMNDCLSEEMRGYESDGAFDGPKMHLLWWKTETPATDAFLDEVRAQGVDASIEHLSKKFEGTGHIGVPVMALEWLAQEIRKGAAQ